VALDGLLQERAARAGRIGADRRRQPVPGDEAYRPAPLHAGLLSAGIFAFTLAQNEFLYALIFLAKSDVRTVPIGAITELIRGDVFYWGQLMAAALLGSVPVAVIYSFFVEYYVAGLTAGSVKG
jgi:ABC-type glycerol-3-phosphate transport system permease component